MGRYVSNTQRVKKQQVFTASGTFIPSARLIAAGGVVTVQCIGGGGGGGSNDNSNHYGGGGGSGENKTRIVNVNAATAVLVGAGGTGQHHVENVFVPASDGGDTSFGTLVVAKGGGRAGNDDPHSGAWAGSAGGENGFCGEKGAAYGTGINPGGDGGGPGSGPGGNDRLSGIRRAIGI